MASRLATALWAAGQGAWQALTDISVPPQRLPPMAEQHNRDEAFPAFGQPQLPQRVRRNIDDASCALAPPAHAAGIRPMLDNIGLIALGASNFEADLFPGKYAMS